MWDRAGMRARAGIYTDPPEDADVHDEASRSDEAPARRYQCCPLSLSQLSEQQSSEHGVALDLAGFEAEFAGLYSQTEEGRAGREEGEGGVSEEGRRDSRKGCVLRFSNLLQTLRTQLQTSLQNGTGIHRATSPPTSSSLSVTPPTFFLRRRPTARRTNRIATYPSLPAPP